SGEAQAGLGGHRPDRERSERTDAIANRANGTGGIDREAARQAARIDRRSMTQSLRIATRGSRLALWQANHIADLLRPLIAPRPIELVEIRTTGDQHRTESLAKIGGQGVFTKEIQQAVANGRAHVAVHSLKDLPTQSVPQVVLAAVPRRAPASDVFVSERHRSF